MAYDNGSVANGTAFYAALINFLKTDTDLVAAGQQWTEVWTGSGAFATDKVLRGPGMSGGDQVYVGFRLITSAPGDSFRLDIVGMTGLIATATQFNQHANCSPIMSTFLDVNAMDYWFVANGRRFSFVSKISTVYETGYAGLFLPYGDPVSYSYPMFIGGTYRPGSSINDTTWRSTSVAHANFVRGQRSPGLNVLPAAVVLDPAGEWRNVCGTPDPSAEVGMLPGNLGIDGSNFGIADGFVSTELGYSRLKDNISACFDGAYALTPLTMFKLSPSQVYGVLEGVYHVPGLANSSENIVTIGSDDHLVVQNVFRAGTSEFLALKLG